MTDNYSSAMEIALRKLGASDRFEEEIRRALSGFSSSVVDLVVARLRERGLINEERAAQSLAERNAGRRAVGVERLREKLERRGAQSASAERVLGKAAADESARATSVVESKYPDRAPEHRIRAARLLASRGFAEEAIESALIAVFGESTGPSENDVFIE
jgi:SOS response regulatory protein OraA/RecX